MAEDSDQFHDQLADINARIGELWEELDKLRGAGGGEEQPPAQPSMIEAELRRLQDDLHEAREKVNTLWRQMKDVWPPRRPDEASPEEPDTGSNYTTIGDANELAADTGYSTSSVEKSLNRSRLTL